MKLSVPTVVTASGLTPSMARAFRVALGLDAVDVARRVGVSSAHLLRAEDGDVPVRCGWDLVEVVLEDELARWVERDGRPWPEIRLPPFQAWRIRAAAGVVIESAPDDFGADLDW